MKLKLIRIRYIQIKREAGNAGIYSIPVLAGLIFLVFFCAEIYQIKNYGWVLTGLLFLTCLSIQINRKDRIFVATHIENPHFEIFSEYVVLTLPFSISALLTVNRMCFPALVTSLLVLPLISYNIKRKTMFRKLSLIIPASDFEWISGFRKSFAFLFPLYLLAAAFCWFNVLPLFILWLFTVSILPFYGECESYQVLRESNQPFRKFINQKILRHIKYLLLLSIPVLIINTIFNPDYWMLNIIFIAVQVSLLTFAITLKYAFYTPNQKLAAKNLIISLVSFSSIVPYFLPVPVIMSLIYYKKAKNNLRNYFDD